MLLLVYLLKDITMMELMQMLNLVHPNVLLAKTPKHVPNVYLLICFYLTVVKNLQDSLLWPFLVEIMFQELVTLNVKHVAVKQANVTLVRSL